MKLGTIHLQFSITFFSVVSRGSCEFSHPKFDYLITVGTTNTSKLRFGGGYENVVYESELGYHCVTV